MKVLSKIITVISVLLLMWFLISTIEVNIKNTKPNPEYSKLNLWAIAIEGVQK